jgi:hypothetical protein
VFAVGEDAAGEELDLAAVLCLVLDDVFEQREMHDQLLPAGLRDRHAAVAFLCLFGVGDGVGVPDAPEPRLRAAGIDVAGAARVGLVGVGPAVLETFDLLLLQPSDLDEGGDAVGVGRGGAFGVADAVGDVADDVVEVLVETLDFALEEGAELVVELVDDAVDAGGQQAACVVDLRLEGVELAGHVDHAGLDLADPVVQLRGAGEELALVAAQLGERRHRAGRPAADQPVRAAHMRRHLAVRPVERQPRVLISTYRHRTHPPFRRDPRSTCRQLQQNRNGPSVIRRPHTQRRSSAAIFSASASISPGRNV